MSAGFFNYTDGQIYSLSTDSGETFTHNQTPLSIAIRFRLLTLTGTTETTILSNGVFQIRRKTGTAAEFEIFFTNAASTNETQSLGNLVVDTDYVVTFKGNTLSWDYCLNGTNLGSFATTGNTWNPGAAVWLIGPSTTEIDVHIYEIAFYTAEVSDANMISFDTDYFDNVTSTGLIGHFNFNTEYFGTINTSDINCLNQGSGFPDLDLTGASGIDWTGDDPIIPVADISVEVGGTAVSDGGSIEVNKKLHESIAVDLINANVSNAGEIIAINPTTYGLDQTITVAASSTDNQLLYIPKSLTHTVTFYGKGRIFGETDYQYTITLEVLPNENDRLRFLEQIKVTHIRGYGT